MVFQLIDGFFEKRPRVGIANEQPPVVDLDIMVENGIGRGVHIGDKSVLVDCDRGQAHRIERGGWGRARSWCSSDRGNLDQAPGEVSKNALFLSAQVADFRSRLCQDGHSSPERTGAAFAGRVADQISRPKQFPPLLLIKIKSLFWRLRPDAEKFAAPVRSNHPFD